MVQRSTSSARCWTRCPTRSASTRIAFLNSPSSLPSFEFTLYQPRPKHHLVGLKHSHKPLYTWSCTRENEWSWVQAKTWLQLCVELPTPRSQEAHLEIDTARARRDSAKLVGLPTGAVMQLRRRSMSPLSLTLEVRRALYSAALRSAAQRLVRASSLASWSRFSRCAQFIWFTMDDIYKNRNCWIV